MLIMKNVLVTLLLIVGFNPIKAQLSELKHSDELAVKINYSRVTMTGPNYEWKYAQRYTYNAIGWELENYSFGGARYSISNKLIELACQYLKFGIKDDLPFSYSNGAPDVGSLLLQSRFGFPVFSTDNFNLAAGFSFGDSYLFQPTYGPDGEAVLREDGSVKSKLHESSGWYVTAGPAVFIDFFIAKRISFHAKGSFDFSLARMSDKNVEDVGKYKKPFFWYFYPAIHHDSGFFVGYEIWQGMDRESTDLSLTRYELKIGYQFYF